MPQPFTDDEVEKLTNFIGYGRLDAPVWFLGMEEAGGDEFSLRKRVDFSVVEDLKVAHEKIHQDRHHGIKQDLQGTWNPMCGIMLELQGGDLTNDTERRRTYQSEYLGRHGGDTLLLELLPIPSKDAKRWEYKELLPQFFDRDDYEEKMMKHRVPYIRDLVLEHQPSVVICHGKGKRNQNVRAYEAIFSDMRFKWVPEVPKVAHVKIGKHWKVAFEGGRCVLITQNLSRISRLGKFEVVFPSFVEIIERLGCKPLSND